MNSRIEKTIDSLKDKGYNVLFFEDIENARKEILDNISTIDSIGIGGSMTIYDMDLHNDFIDRGNKVYWHWLVEPNKRNEVRELARNSDVYLSSTNAVTKDGKLINIDGIGNRVTSIVYGHSKVYIIAGVNKIVDSIEDGINRIKTVSCPLNSKRLDLNTPCRYDKCIDCKSQDRMCNITVIVDNKPMNADITIIFIDKELGY